MAGRDLPEPVAEHRFHDVRKWRFDFAWPDLRIAVECEGGTFKPGRSQGRGRHLRSTGFHEDCDKYNAAAAVGWLVLRFDSKHLRTDPVGCVDLVRQAMQTRKAG